METIGSTPLDGAPQPERRPTEWQRLRTHHLARALAQFEAGDDHVDELRASKRCELEALRASGIFERVQLQVRRESCAACCAVAGRQMAVADALTEVPLPVAGCTCRRDGRDGWCTCEYVGVVADAPR